MSSSSSRQENDFLGTRNIPGGAGTSTNPMTLGQELMAFGVTSADDVRALLVPEKLTRPMRLEG